MDGMKERLMRLIRAGVPEDKLDAYLALADLYGKDGDFAQGLEAAMGAFPLPVAAESAPRIVASAIGAPEAGAAWKGMSLRERGMLFRENPEKAREMAAEAGETIA